MRYWGLFLLGAHLSMSAMNQRSIDLIQLADAVINITKFEVDALSKPETIDKFTIRSIYQKVLQRMVTNNRLSNAMQRALESIICEQYDEMHQDEDIIDLSFAQLSGHTDAITSWDMNASGSLIVSGGKDHSIRVWHEQPDRSWQSHIFWHCLGAYPTAVRIASLSGLGNKLLTGHTSSRIYEWDVSSLLSSNLKPNTICQLPEEYVPLVCNLSNEGNFLATIVRSQEESDEHTVLIYRRDITEWKPVGNIPGILEGLCMFDIHADENPDDASLEYLRCYGYTVQPPHYRRTEWKYIDRIWCKVDESRSFEDLIQDVRQGKLRRLDDGMVMSRNLSHAVRVESETPHNITVAYSQDITTDSVCAHMARMRLASLEKNGQ